MTPQDRKNTPRRAEDRPASTMDQARRMRQARRLLGLSLTEMAAMLGYQGSQMRQQMDDLETGRRPIREPQRRLVEAYLEGYRPRDWPHQGQ